MHINITTLKTSEQDRHPAINIDSKDFSCGIIYGMYKGENEGVDEGKATVLCEKISKAVREYLEWD